MKRTLYYTISYLLILAFGILTIHGCLMCRTAISDEDTIRELVFRRLSEITLQENSLCTVVYVLREDKLGMVSDSFIDRFKDSIPTIRKTLREDEYDERDKRVIKYTTFDIPERAEYNIHALRGYIFGFGTVEWKSPTEISLFATSMTEVRIINGKRRPHSISIEFHLRKENGKWAITQERRFVT